MLDSKKKQIFIFAIVSGCFLMSMNAVTIIIPLRMTDMGLNYSEIGGIMSAFSLGILGIKIITGRHADIVGQKKYLLASLLLGAIILIFMFFASTMLQYLVLLCCLGVCRGIFTSINSSYTVDLADESTVGNDFGNILGISSLFTSCGGMLAGVLYRFQDGGIAFLIMAAFLLVAAVLALLFLPTIANTDQKVVDKSLFKNINKMIYVCCIVMFLQTFVTSPMWNVVVPMHFYITFGLSATFVGVAMSLDELVGSPTYFIAGRIVDNINIRFMGSISYFCVFIVCLLMTKINQPQWYLCIFLLCSIFITSTYVVMPKIESIYIRKNAKGFEFALISICAGIGDALGNTFFGRLLDKFSINYAFICVGMVYLFIAIILLACIRKNEVKELS